MEIPLPCLVLCQLEDGSGKACSAELIPSLSLLVSLQRVAASPLILRPQTDMETGRAEQATASFL